MTKSDSLCFKVGEGTVICSQKYVEDTDQSRNTIKIPHLALKISKKDSNSEDSDSLIEIESEGDGEIDSPSLLPKKEMILKKGATFKLSTCEDSPTLSI